MDNKFIILIWKMISNEFTGNELKVFCILLKHMDSSYECYPAVRTIAKKYRLSPTTVQKCIDSLEEKKVIVKQNRKSTSNLYKIHSDYIVEKKQKKKGILPKWINQEIQEKETSAEEIAKLQQTMKEIIGEE